MKKTIRYQLDFICFINELIELIYFIKLTIIIQKSGKYFFTQIKKHFSRALNHITQMIFEETGFNNTRVTSFILMVTIQQTDEDQTMWLEVPETAGKYQKQPVSTMFGTPANS